MLENTPDDPDIPYLIAGNYSELVTEQVEYILDHNPELEAIAFANDNRAKAGYRVCAARDLLVEHDIAITGFDDIDHAKTMEPPLTSVSHSSFQFSYQALQNALMLCQGKKPQSCRMSAIFHQRSSFFFFFDKPVIHQENELAEYPDEIYLAAYYHDEKSVYHEPGKCPKVPTANGFSSFLPKEHSHCYTSFILFSGAFALRTVSERLHKCLPKDAITARLSGDEFVSFILTDILKHSDAILYEEKVKRRASIKK